MPSFSCLTPARSTMLMLAWLSTSCSPASDTSQPTEQAEVWGIYRLTAPYHNIPSFHDVPVPDASVELTADHAVYHAGSVALTAKYTVENGYVNIKSESGQIGFQRIGKDTLRNTDAMGNYVDYVRAQ